MSEWKLPPSPRPAFISLGKLIEFLSDGDNNERERAEDCVIMALAHGELTASGAIEAIVTGVKVDGKIIRLDEPPTHSHYGQIDKTVWAPVERLRSDFNRNEIISSTDEGWTTIVSRAVSVPTAQVDKLFSRNETPTPPLVDTETVPKTQALECGTAGMNDEARNWLMGRGGSSSRGLEKPSHPAPPPFPTGAEPDKPTETPSEVVEKHREWLEANGYDASGTRQVKKVIELKFLQQFPNATVRGWNSAFSEWAGTGGKRHRPRKVSAEVNK